MAVPANMIVLDAGDNVGVALRDIAAGEFAVDAAGHGIKADEAIPQGHKIALVKIRAGEKITRFGVPVAVAVPDIAAGRLVHVHNVKSQYLNNDHDHYE
ncbi:UxaA family hydrolase [Mesorhizobium sp. CN2-181]|uniref:UxaA family hydrolase n=1 Tax=Mesorhizobium yinganensis TaxID=3157707 RepID=UPI0032B740AA